MNPPDIASPNVCLLAVGPAKPLRTALANRETSIGSAAGNDLVIEDPSVSRRHARLASEGGVLRLFDLQSTNGTFVNGRRVNGSVMVELDDELGFGSARYLLQAMSTAPRASDAGATPKTAAATLASGSQQPPVLAAPARKPPRAAAIVGMVAAVFAAGFVLTEYVENWDRIEQAADYAATPISSSASVSASSRRAASGPPATAAVAAPAPPTESPVLSLADRPWLARFNYYRSLAGLPQVKSDPLLSAGDAAHARYLVKNYGKTAKAVTLGIEAHEEDPSNRWYSAQGATAAASSDITEGLHPGRDNWMTPAYAIDGWIGTPFHRLWLLNPALLQAGYGQYCEGGYCVGSLNVASGIDSIGGPAPLASPVEFPPSGSALKIGEGGAEWPDPLASCSGYTLPTGLPITLQMGLRVDARLSAYSLIDEASPGDSLEACGFDSTTYTNSDAEQQQRAREIMRDLGAVVVIPRAPLAPGRYKVSLTVNAHDYSWAFAIRG